MEAKNLIKGKVWYDDNGTHLWDEKNNMIADVRGWGRFQRMCANKDDSIDFEKAERLQDTVGRFIAEAINEKLERERGA